MWTRPNAGTDDDAVLCRLEHVERFFIGEVAMIDAIDVIANGPFHRGRGACMTGDALVPFMRNLDRGRHFDPLIEVISARALETNSSPEMLILMLSDPLAAAKPNRAPDLVGPVGDHSEAFGVHMLLAFVAKAAGHRDFRPGGAIARPAR